MDLINDLYNDESLSKWLRYSYDKMTFNKYPDISIKDMVNHFRCNGYSDTDIRSIAKKRHRRNEVFWALV